MTIGVPKIQRPEDKDILKELEKFNELERQAFRFGLTSEKCTIKGNLLPKICEYIYEADRRRRPEDEEFLIAELSAHGINYEDAGIGNIHIKHSSICYILYRIAGCTNDEITAVLLKQTGWDYLIRTRKDHFKQMYKKVQERKEFFLINPELDWKKEKIGTRQLPSLKELLEKIKNASGLDPLEIFNAENIPEYDSRKIKHSKSNEYRSLKVVLDEVLQLLTNPNWDDILRKVNGLEDKRIQKRNKSAVVHFSKSIGKYNMLSLETRKAIAKARQVFKESSTAKMYPIDETDWSVPEM